MRRALRLLLWPGMLVLLVLATIAVNVVLVVIATSDGDPPAGPAVVEKEAEE
jgi:hypothetical protein